MGGRGKQERNSGNRSIKISDCGITVIRFRNEIRITYLHELGHYLGLDEDDLFERGLE
jgi:predicted Zn-dependent protease with MMP-like domain